MSAEKDFNEIKIYLLPMMYNQTWKVVLGSTVFYL